MTSSLRDLVAINPRYRRSANLEADFGSVDALDGYVLSPLSYDAGARIIEGLTELNGNRAWNLVGPYGSGKSSFLLFLGALVAGGDALARARALIEDAPHTGDGRLANALGRLETNLVPVLITGEHTDLRLAVLRGLSSAAKRHWSGPGLTPTLVHEISGLLDDVVAGKDVPDSVVVETVLLLADKVRQSTRPGAGLCIMIDEMGKLVEWAALRRTTSDIYLLQQLAEVTARSQGPRICLVTTLHQSLDAYAEGLPRAVRQEWAKVGGRFELIPYLESPRHVVRLIAGAMSIEPALRETPVARLVSADAKKLEEVTQAGVLPVDVLASCAPLHPVTALALGPLFRMRLGQNERSLFAFLCSHEPHGFQTYLAATPVDRPADPLRLDRLYDYVLANTGVRVVGADSDRTWAATEQSLARLPEDATRLESRALKCIALLTLVGPATGLRADEATLGLALGIPKANVRLTLERLLSASCIVYRDFKKSYQIWDGSDLDLTHLVIQARQTVRAQGKLAERLQRLFPPFPVVASRHYHQTGTLRHLVPRYVGAPSSLTDWPQGESGDGDLFFVVPDRLEQIVVVRTMLGQPESSSMVSVGATRRPQIVALPRRPDDLFDSVVEYFAIDEVLMTTAELANDPVGRRELHERKLRAQDRVADALSRSFTSEREPEPLDWYFKGGRVGAKTRPSSLASEIFDKAYVAAPPVANELVNRVKLSAAAAGARRAVMERLFTHLREPRLGIEGYPAELPVYRSVFENSGLHCEVDGVWDLRAPQQHSPYSATWEALDALLAELNGERVTVAGLVDQLRAPPFGIRDGVAPLVLLAYYLTRRAELFLYEDNSFIPTPGDDLVPRLLKRPGTFELQQARAELRIDGIVQAMASALPASSPAAQTLLDVVKQVVSVVIRLSPYASKTQELSDAARRARSAIKAARDPVRLMLAQLPEALGLSPFSPTQQYTPAQFDKYARCLGESLGELQSLDDSLLKRIDATIRRFLGGVNEAPDAFYRSLIERAKPLESRTFLPLVARNFVAVTASASTATTDLLDLYLGSVATAIIGKPATHWSDTDAQQFDYRALEVSRAFLAAEEMMLALNEGHADGQRNLMRVSVLDSTGLERHGIAAWSANGKLTAFLDDVQSLATKHGIASNDLAFAVVASMMDRLAEHKAQENAEGPPL